MAADPRAVYQRWIDELWAGTYEVAGELVADDFAGHWPDHEVQGREALVEVIRETRAMAPDLTFSVALPPIAEGDVVAGRWTGSATTSDGPMRFVGNDLLRIDAEGRFCEYWVASWAGPAT